MVHKKIRIPKESANEILFALGKLKNAIEFEDLTKNDIEAKKSFGDMIKRCDEMKKKIDDFIQICKEFQVPLNINNTFYDLNSRLSLDMQNRDKKLGLTYFDLVESEIMKNSRKISDLVDSHEQMRENLILLIEKKHVLEKASELIRDSLPLGNFSESGADEDGFLASINSNLVLMAGTVPTNVTSGNSARKVSRAFTLIVLQATTITFGSNCDLMFSTSSSTQPTTCSWDFSP